MLYSEKYPIHQPTTLAGLTIQLFFLDFNKESLRIQKGSLASSWCQRPVAALNPYGPFKSDPNSLAFKAVTLIYQGPTQGRRNHSQKKSSAGITLY